MKYRFLPLIAILFVLAACQSKEEIQTRETRLSEGFKMMDQNLYDDAIVYFADLLKTDAHFHVKMALASAYAGRAGIRLQEIYSFVVVREVPVPALELKGVSLDKQAADAIKGLHQAAQHWVQIPTVDVDKREDLLAGLDALKAEPEPGARLYAAVLRIVVLKSAIYEGIASFEKLSVPEPKAVEGQKGNETDKEAKDSKEPEKKKICAKDLVPYTEWAAEIVRGLSYLAMDLEVSFPEEKKQYADLRLKAEATVSQLKAIKLPAGENKCF